MDVEDDRLSSTEPLDLADEATAETEKKELPLRLHYWNGPIIHRQLCIDYGVANTRCEKCGQVGQLTCFAPSYRKWALRRVTEEEINQICSLCKERGHNRLECDHPIRYRLPEVPAPKLKRPVHCGFCGEAGHNRRTCLKAGRN